MLSFIYNELLQIKTLLKEIKEELKKEAKNA